MAHQQLTNHPPFIPDSSADFVLSSPASNSPRLSPKDIQLPPSPQDDDEPLSLPDTPSRRPFASRVDSYPSHTSTLQLPFRPRNSSPSRSQMRPHSSGGISSLPPMQRAHSSPGVDSSGRFIQPVYAVPRRPSSPLSSGRRRSPLRSAIDDFYPGAPSWSGFNIEPNIPENAELEIISESDLSHPLPVTSYSNTFPRSRRRPTSPLHQSASAPSLQTKAGSPNLSGGTSPNLAAHKYANEPYPIYSFSSASSMPSTPTSLRSRSPSISSLETIEDIPDAEEAALLEEEEASKQRVEDLESIADARRRSSLELRGSGLKSNKERKRWSVCGAERRADFSLEPIEE